jgi:LDH2 family malate/lactate/ureidoglycolate dehydrogenase
MITIPADQLRDLGVKLFTAQGASIERSEYLVNSLVDANLTGHDSHGAHYYIRYSERIKNGHIFKDAVPEVVKESPGSALIDGKWTFGQITAKTAVELAVKKAKENMVAGVGAFNCNHIGRLGWYTSWAAKQGIITTMYANVGHPSVSVHNGFGRTFGTNPYSASVPTSGDTPFLVDYATSVVAHGKVSVAKAAKKDIPSHWTRDKEGKVTTNSQDLDDGGWLLPIGGYKGMGLQMVSELIGAVLTGSRVGPAPYTDPPSPNGVFIMAINPEGFIGADKFKTDTASLIETVKAWPSLEGEQVLVPGMPEEISKEKRLKDGIQLPEETWEEMVALCKEHGVDLDAILK